MTRLSLVALLALAALACGGDPPVDGPGDGGDASGGGGGEGGEGGGEVVSHGVTVVDERGRAQAGIDVVLHDASGAVVSTHRTDSNGRVDVTREPGQMVSVVWIEADRFHGVRTVHTVAGAAPDAPLRFVASPFVQPMPQAWINTSVTGSDDDVLTQASCFENSMLGVGTLGYVPCANSDTFDVIVHHLTNPPRWQVFPDQPSTGGELTLALDPDLGEPAPRIDVVASDVPPDATRVSGVLWAYRPGGGYNVSSGGVDASQSQFPTLAIRPIYAPSGSRIEHRGQIEIADGPQYHVNSSWHDQPQQQISASPVPLAGISDVTVGVPVAWSLGEGPRGDAMAVTMSFPSIDPSDPAERPRRVIVHLPADATSVTLPSLPPELASWAPTSAPTQITLDHVVADGDGVAAVSNARADGTAQQWIRRYAQAPGG